MFKVCTVEDETKKAYKKAKVKSLIKFLPKFHLRLDV